MLNPQLNWTCLLFGDDFCSVWFLATILFLGCRGSNMGMRIKSALPTDIGHCRAVH